MNLNALKGIACICVVWIHAPFPGIVGKVVSGIARFAVPLFFAIAGYYIYDGNKEKVAKKLVVKIKYIGKILIWMEGTYFCWFFIQKSIECGELRGGFEWIKQTFTVKAVINCIIFQKTIVIDVAWFLLALFLCYVLTVLINRYDLWKKTGPLILALLFLNLCIAKVGFFVSHSSIPWYWNANLWLLGFPCYVIGYCIKINWEKLMHITTKSWILIAIVSVVLCFIEIFGFGTRWFYISNISFMVSCLVLCLKYPNAILLRGGGEID